MRLFSYVVARDYGFAPNPFFGHCTLATCKPEIRGAAGIGDWVIGTGSKRYDLQGRLVYTMRVGEVLTYDQYWSDPRFEVKRPNLHGSIKQAFGDNIYHRGESTRRWQQEDSHHSLSGGVKNRFNVVHDTRVPRVLTSDWFAYWGREAVLIPKRFRHGEEDVCCQRGHKCRFTPTLVRSFVEWVRSLEQSGYLGEPAEFGSQLRHAAGRRR